MKLIAYVPPGDHVDIRPAPVEREWMEETDQRYAYRCLPLNIANAHGWEVLTPAGFTAYWRGGASTQDVIIRSDPDMPTFAAPLSLFGQATITIHIQGLFRTPPGWNLMATGSPNRAKDGIAPLSGGMSVDDATRFFCDNCY